MHADPFFFSSWKSPEYFFLHFSIDILNGFADRLTPPASLFKSLYLFIDSLNWTFSLASFSNSYFFLDILLDPTMDGLIFRSLTCSCRYLRQHGPWWCTTYDVTSCQLRRSYSVAKNTLVFLVDRQCSGSHSDLKPWVKTPWGNHESGSWEKH